MANLTAAAKNIFDDLLTLEVNVIVKPGMTARKIPTPAQALLDVLSDYDIWLCEFAGRINPAWARYRVDPATPLPPPLPDAARGRVWTGTALIESLPSDAVYDGDTTTVTAAAFDTLRERARTAEVMYRLLLGAKRIAGGDDGSAVLLKRIYRNCDQIKGVLSRAELPDPGAAPLNRRSTATRDLVLSADDQLIVRKVWEVGTETIVMQTVAQLDGDVVTRVQQARAGVADEPIQTIHREAVANALKHWQFLVETLVTLTTKAAGFLAR
jgi:hypothetical protein